MKNTTKNNIEHLSKINRNPKVAPKIAIGSRWKDQYNQEFILVEVDGIKCALIHLQSGNRYRNAVRTGNRFDISVAEWELIRGHDDFTCIRINFYAT